MSVSKIKIKNLDGKIKQKHRNDVKKSTLLRIWKISHPYPGCSFVWKIQVVYFSVKHSYLCNKTSYLCLHSLMKTSAKFARILEQVKTLDCE